MADNKAVRFNFMMGLELKEWVDKQAEITGISSSAFVNLCVAQYKQQMEGLKAMQNVSELVNQLSSIKEGMEKLQKENKEVKNDGK